MDDEKWSDDDPPNELDAAEIAGMEHARCPWRQDGDPKLCELDEGDGDWCAKEVGPHWCYLATK